MCVSTGASVSMESIANEHRRYIKEKYPQSYSQLWFQIYVTKNRNFSKNLIERAERCGYKALVLTVDTCAIGNRECDIHNNFSLPDGIRAENFIDENNIIAKTYRQLQIDPSLSWKDLDWIRSITSLPLILKGIMHPDDARKAVRYGVQGIIVSNHGGRQLDTCQSTIEALPDIMAVIRECNYQMDIYIDGGIRRGTDVLKSLALGARAVLIGRPILWGLTVDGEQGVTNVLAILKNEFRVAMMLCGCQNVEDIRKNNLLVMNDNIRSKL
ncbi:unnamed protein product [Rotaria sp. Silwood1]|nr:unnamed protein product [Rotaria sp. Silwood1]CAF4730207.1 unnamed protein product [Rotaria sp. Silwood1]